MYQFSNKKEISFYHPKTKSITELQLESASIFAAYADAPDNLSCQSNLNNWRFELANALLVITPQSVNESYASTFFDFLKLVAQSGRWDEPVNVEEIKLANLYRSKGFSGLIAAMILVPAWQWSEAPKFRELPEWLWTIYAFYIFNAPKGFRAIGQSDLYSSFYLVRLKEIESIILSNINNIAKISLLNIYLHLGNCIPLYFTSDSLLQHYEVRGRLLQLANTNLFKEDIKPILRVGRRLRVGFINRHFGPQTETYTTLPTFEQLDKEKFEVLLFAIYKTDSKLETYCKVHAVNLIFLSNNIEEQLQVLRDNALDVAVFGTNLTAIFNEITRIALHRIAPLQVVNNSSCTTTGLLNADLYISGKLTESDEASSHFSERLALLPGPAHTFNYTADAMAVSFKCERSALGISNDTTLFVSAANYYKIIPEMQVAWAQILAATPNSRLLIHPFNPNWSDSYPVKRFCADFNKVIKNFNLPSDTLIVSTKTLPSRNDVKELLSIGDIYLDTFPFSGVNSLIDPLEVGIPVVVQEGRTFRSRMGASLLRSLEIPELIAIDNEGYIKIATHLALNHELRFSLSERIRTMMLRKPIFLNTLSASDSFGDLLITSYDKLCKEGRDFFKNNRKEIITNT